VAARCKRRVSVENTPSNATTGVLLHVGTDDVEVTIRAVDAAGVPVAWQLRVHGEPGTFHLKADEQWIEERLAVTEEVDFDVISAAGGEVEVVRWSE